MSHTPGPWHITKDTTSGEFCTYTKVRDQRDSVIAIMSTMNEDSNAHLIATAPELLAALEVVISSTLGDVGDDGYEGCIRIEAKALDRAIAAITKAKGGAK